VKTSLLRTSGPDHAHQCGAERLVSVGATPVSYCRPSSWRLDTQFCGVALPAIGFDALCTFALLGRRSSSTRILPTPLVQSVQSSQNSCRHLHVNRFRNALDRGRWKLMREGFIPCIIAGMTNGGCRGRHYTPSWPPACLDRRHGRFSTMSHVIYLKLRGKQIIDRSHLTKDDLNVEAGCRS